MYTRNRQSQGYSNARGSLNNSGNATPYQNSNMYNQQGGYQQSQSSPANQQGNYKPPNVQNPSQPFKPQQQIPLQQTTAARNMQQQMKPQMALSQQPPQQQLQQQQQQQQQQQLQQQLQPTQLQLKQQQQSPSVPQQQRLKPILKQSPSTNTAPIQNTPTITPQASVPTSGSASAPVSAPISVPTSVPVPTSVNNSLELKSESLSSENIEMDMQEQPRWKRNKIAGLHVGKVNRKLKRLRMNQRLRKTLQPKNAIMVLNEMKTGVQFTFPETQAAMPNSLFLVHAEIEGKTYVGQGLSKPLARQNAAENALKCLLLEKMTAAAMKARIDAESDGQITQVDSSQSSVKEENSEITGMPMETNMEETDEIPWSCLASFALYKLFLEWQNQGTVVPVSRPGISPGKVKKEHKTPVQKEPPPNAINIHPVMLLNQMRPGLTYVEVNRVGNPPNTMFTLAVDIDGVEYTGAAKNKKDAKKTAAKAALSALYDITYPEETKMDHTEDILLC